MRLTRRALGSTLAIGSLLLGGQLATSSCASTESVASEDGSAGVDAAVIDAAADVLTPSEFVESLAQKKVLWIAAHPDDEFMFSALAGELGAERGAKLAFLVSTRGEKATDCFIPEGCKPDIATVRDGEMQRAADFLGGAPTQVVNMMLPDGTNGFEADKDPRPVVAAWSKVAGGQDALVDRYVEAIRTLAPGVIFAQDPRHGDSCHPDHRATGWLVIKALKKMGAGAPPLYVGAFALDFAGGGLGTLPRVADDPSVIAVDEARWAPRIGDDLWRYIYVDHTIHRSQFPLELNERIAKTPAKSRKTHWIPMTDFPADVRYDGCGVVFGHGADDVGSSDAGADAAAD